MRPVPERALALASAALVVMGSGAGLFATQTQPDRFLLACSAFPPTTTDADLRARFGSENVSVESVADPNGAEGDMTEGTVLFAKDATARLEISWRDATEKRRPSVISRLASRGRWHTPSGITLGTNLKAIEKLNGRPFRLAGLAFDLQGTVMSWRGGRLQAEDTEDCHLGVRLRVESAGTRATVELEKQVMGDGEFSSGHPAMQALNPTVYELRLWYGRRPG